MNELTGFEAVTGDVQVLGPSRVELRAAELGADGRPACALAITRKHVSRSSASCQFKVMTVLKELLPGVPDAGLQVAFCCSGGPGAEVYPLLYFCLPFGSRSLQVGKVPGPSPRERRIEQIIPIRARWQHSLLWDFAFERVAEGDREVVTAAVDVGGYWAGTWVTDDLPVAFARSVLYKTDGQYPLQVSARARSYDRSLQTRLYRR